MDFFGFMQSGELCSVIELRWHGTHALPSGCLCGRYFESTTIKIRLKDWSLRESADVYLAWTKDDLCPGVSIEGHASDVQILYGTF